MKAKTIDNFLTNLTSEEKKYILNKLKKAVFGDSIKTANVCPCCGENDFIKKGNYKGVQKYRCKRTSKIFSYRTASILSGVWDLEKMEELMEYMIEKGFPTLDEIEKKIGISRKTAHDWRSKIITATFDEVEFSNQVIEFDETNYRLSRKGRQGMTYSRVRGGKLVGDNPYNVKVFMTYSRTTGKLELFQSHMGRSSQQDVANYLGVNKNMVVYSDRHRSYKKYYKSRRLLHGTFKAKDHISKWNKAIHNQTLNYHSKALGDFIDRQLKGVSTKYIQGYLNWYMFIQNSVKKVKEVSLKNIVMENKVALDIFKQKEKEFQYFLKVNGRSDYGTCRDRYY